jgi:hypothetical protein
MEATMWKPFLGGAVALAIAGSSLAYAQQGPAGPERAQRWQPNAEDFSALTDARIAGLKAALKLTLDQEKNWPAVERAIRDLAKEHIDRMTARREARRDRSRTADPIEGLRRRADALNARAAGLNKLADASAPLYQSLDDAQKRRLTFLVRSMVQRRMAFGLWHGQRGPVDIR